tara:strand:- start:509 stop:1966 length:1458 start_codon:yes stop_codon:yes gene_type:complete
MASKRTAASVLRNGPAYLVAFVAAIACLAAERAVEPMFVERSAFLMVMPALLIGAVLGGVGPALLVVVLGLIGNQILTNGSLTTNPANLISAITFSLLGVFCGLASDALRRGRSEQRESVEGLRALLDAVPDAMFQFDARGVIRSFSASAVRMFGWSAEDITGRPVWDLFPESSHAPIRDCLEAVETNAGYDGFGGTRLLLGQRHDGTGFQMELSVCRNGSTTVRLFTGFARDLTDRMVEQERIRALEAELMHMARLTAMGQMTTTLAHELNQPLAAATNFMMASERLLSRPSPDIPMIVEALRSGVEQTMRAGDIIRRLRVFITKREPHRSLEDIAEVLREAAALAMAGSYDIDLRWEVEPRLDPVLIDRIQIQQVVVNLVRNAREAMAGAADRRLVIGLRREGPLIVVSVSDSGPGVEPAIASHLLDAFVTSKPHGLGVGLSISRNIVESHGGGLWLDPSEGPGATFRFTLAATAEEAVFEAA